MDIPQLIYPFIKLMGCFHFLAIMNNAPKNICVGFPSDSVVKNPPAVQETRQTQVRFLGQEDPLEKEMAARSSILTWRIPWTAAWWAAVHGVAKSWTRLKLLSTAHTAHKHLCTLLFVFSKKLCIFSVWLCWVFVTARALLYCREWGLLSSYGAQASHCSGSSCCRAWALGCVGFSSCGSRVLGCRLGSCGEWA